MKKTVPPLFLALPPSETTYVRMLCDDGKGGLVSQSVPESRVLGRGVTWLAKQLGVSKRRARVLLAAGRIPGAVKDERGIWDLSKLGQVRLQAGARGPALRRARW